MNRGPVPLEFRFSPWARRGTVLIVALHAALLLASLPDYFADNDLGFHISLGRQYGERGSYFWDSLNWAPTGRPNLQGPLLHYGIGMLGRALGGEGGDYVLAFSLLAVLQWGAAVFTCIFFARRYGGDWAGLFGVALLTGCVWSAASFFVGVPSGWIFVLTPWAIHFFLADRPLLAAVIATLVSYAHLGGAPVAGFGILAAAVFTRRWRSLLFVGGLTLALSSPYVIHFLRHLSWYTGRRGHVAGDIAVLTYLLALPAVVLLLWRPRENVFLLVWPAAPLAWVFQDPLRFLLQSTIAASAVAGIFLASILGRWRGTWRVPACAAAVVLVATLFPLAIPSLAVELAWALGHGFPRELDWREAQTLAGVLERSGAAGRVVNSYYDSLSAGMAVFLPLRQEFGHWGEVRPAVNPAGNLSAAEKVYVLPLPPDDPVLSGLASRGWIEVHGGSGRTTVATLAARPPWPEAQVWLVRIARNECAWLAANAVNNRMPPAGMLLDPAAMETFRRTTTLQRNRAGRVMVTVLLLAYALEGVDAERAAGARGAVRGWGSVANFLGDETAIDYVSDERFDRFRRNAARWGEAVLAHAVGEMSDEELGRLTDVLFDDFFG